MPNSAWHIHFWKTSVYEQDGMPLAEIFPIDDGQWSQITYSEGDWVLESYPDPESAMTAFEEQFTSPTHSWAQEGF